MACGCSNSPCSCPNPTNLNMNNAAQLNICTRRGDTFILNSVVASSNGVKLDLTLYSFKMEVREYDNGPLVIADTDISATGDINGNLVVTITAANMQVPAGTYVYGFQSTLTSAGTVETWFYGTFEVVQDIVT
eukprot:COSAG06_NODE_14096_length_1190_cov_6.497285_2_plen_133_part_00